MTQAPLRNFVETISESLRNHWEVPCFTNLNGPTITYGEVAQQIMQLHGLFKDSGIKQDDRIALVGRNSANWCITYLATITYGAIIVPILPDFTGAEIEHIVRHSEAKLMFAATGNRDQIDEEKIPSIHGVLALEDFALDWSNDPKVTAAAEAMNNTALSSNLTAASELAFADIPNDNMVAIVYTSGTTGFSKGVMLDANSLEANVEFFNTCIDMTPGDNIVSFLPLAHAFGCAFDFLAPFAVGCHMVMISQMPTPKILLKAFDDYKPVVVMSVPLIIEKIYRNKIKPVIDTPKMQFMLKVPGLKTIIHKKIKDQIYGVFGGQYKQMVIGGAALNKEIELFFKKIGLNITCGYGMTECGPLISYSANEDNPPPASVGRIIPCMECRIFEADATTGIGEVQVRGINRMLGYYNDTEATNGAINPEGWLLTGDLGRLDDDGFLFLTGRSKNMILTASGQNVFPEEIESQLNNMPCVEESLIIDNSGQLMALVYPNLESVDKACLKGKQVEELMEENRKAMNLGLPGFSQIKRLKVLYEEFEKTPTKKIKRRLYNAFR